MIPLTNDLVMVSAELQELIAPLDGGRGCQDVVEAHEAAGEGNYTPDGTDAKKRRRTVIYTQGRWRYQGREYPTLRAALLAAWPEGRR